MLDFLTVRPIFGFLDSKTDILTVRRTFARKVVLLTVRLIPWECDSNRNGQTNETRVVCPFWLAAKPISGSGLTVSLTVKILQHCNHAGIEKIGED